MPMEMGTRMSLVRRWRRSPCWPPAEPTGPRHGHADQALAIPGREGNWRPGPRPVAGQFDSPGQRLHRITHQARDQPAERDLRLKSDAVELVQWSSDSVTATSPRDFMAKL